MALLPGVAVPATAAAEEALSAWLAGRDSATGTWSGARTELEQAGVTPALNFTTDLMTNPVGGMSQSGAYAGGWTASVDADLETLFGLPGLSFFVAASSQQGRDLSEQHIGNVFDVAEVFNGNGVRLNQLYLAQDLFGGAANVAVGRLSAGDDFATLEGYGYYVSGAVNGNPTSILVNLPSFTTPPYAQWGSRVTLAPEPAFYVSAGVYNADPAVQEDSKHGVDFRLNPGDGVLTLAEVGYRPNQDGSGGGLPGHYALGGYYDSSAYALLDDPAESETGNYGLYLLAQQTIHRPEEGSERGLIAWASVTFGPDQSVNTMPYAAYAGAFYQGLSAARPDDVTAVAVYYGAFSDRLPDQSYELVFEANHRFQFASWLYVTPDAQYVVNPGGGGIPDAAVFGLEVSVDF